MCIVHCAVQLTWRRIKKLIKFCSNKKLVKLYQNTNKSNLKIC